MDKIDIFQQEQNKIRELDFAGKAIDSCEMHRQYLKRNTFGLDSKKRIHRIFQKDFYEKDRKNGILTLPLASSINWNDPLENPLSNIHMTDPETGITIHLGSLTSSFYALCWTERENSERTDWEKFSHGKEAVRVSTTVGKLMSRIMRTDDPSYMHRSWLIDVGYVDPTIINAMKSPDEVFRRMESTGSLLVLSAAVVQSQFSTENEVRLIFDGSINPPLQESVYLNNNRLVKYHLTGLAL